MPHAQLWCTDKPGPFQVAARNLWITKEAKCSPSLLSSARGTWVFSEFSHSWSPGAKLQKCHQICMRNDNDLLWIGLLSHLLRVSPSCHSPTSVTVHSALPASSGEFAFSVILALNPEVCICRYFSCRFLQQKKMYLLVPPTVKIMQPWEICCNSSHLSLYIFYKTN